MKNKIYCACNGQECEGICRKEHLNRQRGCWAATPKQKGRCPAAYELEKVIVRGK